MPQRSRTSCASRRARASRARRRRPATRAWAGCARCGRRCSPFLQLADAVVLHDREPAPTPAWSWWLQVPFTLTALPLRKKPFAASKRRCGCRTESRTGPTSRCRPRPSSQAGRGSALPATRARAGEQWPAASRSALAFRALGSRLGRQLRDRRAARRASMSRDDARLLATCRPVLRLRVGGQRAPRPQRGAPRTNVPHCFTWTGAVFTSQTCR